MGSEIIHSKKTEVLEADKTEPIQFSVCRNSLTNFQPIIVKNVNKYHIYIANVLFYHRIHKLFMIYSHLSHFDVTVYALFPPFFVD